MQQSEFPRFDMTRKPYRQKNILRPIAWLGCLPAMWKHRVKITRTGMDGLKGPYILLCNHNAFLDYMVSTIAIFPRRFNSVGAISGFVHREWLMRHAGCICKRKFTTDLVLVRQIQRVIQNGDVLVLFPEARYSLCGTAAVLPDSLGKMMKLFQVPVVLLLMHGHHLNCPFWNHRQRNVKGLEAELTQLITAEEVKALSVEQINDRIREAFQYDDFAWQLQRGVKISVPYRAEGLHKVLYQCPACHTEYRMASENDRLYCRHCGKQWRMDELGRLCALEGETEFSHVPGWYEWERAQVRSEVHAGTYGITCEAHVMSLPNSKGYIPLGNATLIHNMQGFTLSGCYEGTPYEEHWAAENLYSCHIEYNYLRKYGDCVDLNTLRDSYYVYPHGEDFSVTKFALATEELYAYYREGGKAD